MPMVLVRALFAAALAVLLAGCADMEVMHRMMGHPLIDKIWDTHAQRFVDEAEVIRQARSARFVLLGESHNQDRHQSIQTEVYEALIRAGRHPALVMEHLDTDRQADIDRVRAAPDGHADDVRKVADLSRGWDWENYAPLVSAALKAGLPLVAGNLSRQSAREVVSRGFDVLGADFAKRTGVERVWNDRRQVILRRLILEGHCGKDEHGMADKLVRAQRAKDAMMADVLLRQDVAVAVLGRGHVRRDVGVPIYLAEREPGAKVLVVGLVEAEDGVENPALYAGPPDAPSYDLIWFTWRPYRPDPCAGGRAT